MMFSFLLLLILKKLKGSQLETYSRIISYAPTFRDFETTEPFFESFWRSLQDFLDRTNQVFIFKTHPEDRNLKVLSNFKNIKDLSHIVDDPRELLLISDLSISSSLTTDFTLTGKPTLIYAYDFEGYKNNCRSIYYDLEEIISKPFVTN